MKKANQILWLSVFPIMIWPLLSFAGTVNLPQTGQTTVYDIGDDGDLQKGVSWPSPRFQDNGDGTVTDNLTGLMWLKDASCFGQGDDWLGALDAVADLNANPGNYSCADYVANHGDWRLPNIVELESLVNAEESSPATWLNAQGFSGVQSSYYWSASIYELSDVGGAWYVCMSYGHVKYSLYRVGPGYSYCVWPVRAGQSGPAQTWQTGQTTVYKPGDDGDLQKGVAWPSPRFTANVDNNGDGDCTDPGETCDGTVTDNLTGLIWLKDPGRFGIRPWDEALSDCKSLADDGVNLTDGSVADDWRLPNRKELFSLIDYSRYNPALPQDAPFENVWVPRMWSFYWSATTYANVTDHAWVVVMGSGLSGGGDVILIPKSSDRYVWPVRAGQPGDPCAYLGGDTDDDGVCDDGDGSGTSGDNHCTGGETQDCDDNCVDTPNENQADLDEDGIGDACDGCTDTDGDGYGNPGFPSNTCSDDMCPDQDSTGFDADGDGCIDSVDGLTDLAETLVEEGVIDEQMQNSLLSKIENASQSATKENICAAVHQLEALINQVNAQTGNKITDEAADILITYTQSVIDWYLDQLPEGESC